MWFIREESAVWPKIRSCCYGQSISSIFHVSLFLSYFLLLGNVSEQHRDYTQNSVYRLWLTRLRCEEKCAGIKTKVALKKPGFSLISMSALAFWFMGCLDGCVVFDAKPVGYGGRVV